MDTQETHPEEAGEASALDMRMTVNRAGLDRIPLARLDKREREREGEGRPGAEEKGRRLVFAWRVDRDG